MTLIYVKTLPRTTSTAADSTGLHKLVDPDTGKRINATKASPKAFDKYPAFYDPKTRRYKTGLDFMVKNTSKGNADKFPPGFEDLVNEEKISKQHELEMKHGVPRGTYKSDRIRKVPDGKGNMRTEHTFMSKFRIQLMDGVTVWDTSTDPNHELSYYVALANKKIANSMAEHQAHKWPEATHVIIEEGKTQEESYNKSSLIGKAMANLENMNDENRLQIAKVLDIASGHIDNKTAYTNLFQYIELSHGQRGETNAEKFNNWAVLLKNAKGREEVEARALLKDLIFFQVVTVRQGTYKWYSADIVIGEREEEAVQFLLSPAKQPEVDKMREDLEERKRTR